MRLIIGITLFFLSYLLYGFYISQFDLNVVSAQLRKETPYGFYDYRGVTNVRTNRSSGVESPQRVIADAKRANLDFLILTDANLYDHSDSSTGYYGNLLVLSEAEYSHLDTRILLYSTDSKHSRFSDPGSAHLFFTDMLSQKATDHPDNLLFMASPFNPGPTWTGPFPPGINGIEILNPKVMSQKAWMQSRLNVLWSFFSYPFNSKFAFLRLYSDPMEELALWDRIAAERFIVGAAGNEASARAIPLADFLVKFPTYQKSFEIFANHILLDSELTGNMPKDRQKILNALKKGQFYFSMDYVGDPRGFIAVIEDGKKVHSMGARLRWNRGLHLKAQLPAEPKDYFEIVVFKDGERVFTSNQTSLDYQVPGPGRYRVLVRVIPQLPFPDGKRWLSWIFSNIFFVDAG